MVLAMVIMVIIAIGRKNIHIVCTHIGIFKSVIRHSMGMAIMNTMVITHFTRPWFIMVTRVVTRISTQCRTPYQHTAHNTQTRYKGNHGGHELLENSCSDYLE